MTAARSTRRALVVGATGIVGQNLGARLAADGWEVYGLSRSGCDRPARACARCGPT